MHCNIGLNLSLCFIICVVILMESKSTKTSFTFEIDLLFSVSPWVSI